MVKVKVNLSIGYPTAEHDDVIELDKEDFEGLSQEEIDDYIHQVAQEWSYNYIEVHAEIVDD